MAAKKKWPKIKLVKGTATQIRRGLGITEEDHRQVEAILRDLGVISGAKTEVKKRTVLKRSKVVAAK